MIKVIIERHIAPSLEAHFDALEKGILQRAVTAPGFISGESLRDPADHNHRVILSTWRTLQDWDRWYRSEERQEMMSQLSLLLDGEEKITVLEHP